MSADFGFVSIKMLTSLAVIIGLILFLFFVLKRLRFNPLSGSRFPVMRVLGTLNLAPKRAIALVEICDHLLIVGIGTESVTLISKLDHPQNKNISEADIPPGERRFHRFLENIGLRQNTSEPGDRMENAQT